MKKVIILAFAIALLGTVGVSAQQAKKETKKEACCSKGVDKKCDKSDKKACNKKHAEGKCSDKKSNKKCCDKTAKTEKKACNHNHENCNKKK